MESDQKRMFLAIVLSGIVLFGWQIYFGPKQKVVTSTQQHVTAVKKENKVVNHDQIKIEETKEASELNSDPELRRLILKSSITSYEFNNSLSLLNATNSNAAFDFLNVFKGDHTNQIFIFDKEKLIPLKFKITEESSTQCSGFDSRYGVSFKAFIDQQGFLHITLDSDKSYQYRFIFNAHKNKLSNHQVKSFLVFTKDITRINVGDDEIVDGKIKWFGLDFNYHLLATIFSKRYAAQTIITDNGTLSVNLVNPQKSLDLKFIYTKKNYDTLINYGSNLDRSVDFGFFGVIAVPLLRALQFFYGLIPNYGVAIILLTLVVRMLTFPLQFKSFKSMKKMQVLQPELNKIKEKFKDDPKRMQQETMELFRREKANPLGGCFPLLLQMPIFFAFYKVLYAAVELVNAPFILWIHDLSVKDPYYVLPVLMALAMFAQQKLTPSTSADPTQQKVMLFMPLIFGIIMKDLPAGLNLYIFVSTILGVLQQLFVYKVIKD